MSIFEDIATRQRRIARARAWIAEQNLNMASAKKSRKKEKVEQAVQQMLSKRKLKSLLKVTITSIDVETTKKDGSTRVVHSFQLAADVE